MTAGLFVPSSSPGVLSPALVFHPSIHLLFSRLLRKKRIGGRKFLRRIERRRPTDLAKFLRDVLLASAALLFSCSYQDGQDALMRKKE